MSDKFVKFSVYELLKLHHISKINTRYCVAHVAIIIIYFFFFFVTFIDTNTYAHTHTHTHTDLNVAIFWKDCKIKYTSNLNNTGLRNLIHSKFKFFNENIRPYEDSGKIERNELKYLHYLNKINEKSKLRKFIFSEVSCFAPELFQRFCLDFKWLKYFSFRSSH